MSGDTGSAEFGHDVLGPIVAEFCLRLWSIGALTRDPDDVAFLFCARGGLRIQLAYERFLAAAQLPATVHVAPLMVSRLAAIRPSLALTAATGSGLLPWAAATLDYEFPTSSISEVARALSGVTPAGAWEATCTRHGLAALLHHSDGKPVVDALVEQAELFTEHVHDALGARRTAVLVDTGLYGTTRELLAEGLPELAVGSALIARSYRPGPATAPVTFGLSVAAAGYSPLRRRTALLRYWQFVEWLFEPELASVRTFAEVDGTVRSNLEVPGWPDQVAPVAGTVYAGLVAYLDELPPGPAEQIVRDADRAWTALRRAIVWPGPGHGDALRIGARSHDFGIDGTWSARPWRGPLAALRGSAIWREGEIARSGARWRLPLLAVVEAAYGARYLKRSTSGRLPSGLLRRR